jgi:hypothetical protein
MNTTACLSMRIRGIRNLRLRSARHRLLPAAAIAALAASALTGAFSPAPALAASAAPVIRWGNAAEVPGLAALNAGGSAGLSSVSCWRAGDCFAGGSYTDASKHEQAFVVGEKNGHWGNAEELPGTASLNAGGSALVSSVSCSSDGDCAAGGNYANAGGGRQVFVATEKAGHWGRAEEVPGTAKLNIGGFAAVLSISCARRLNCSAAGYYQGYNPPGTGTNSFIAYVVTAKNGRWGKAAEPPGLARVTPSQYPESMTTAISCPSPGNCTAGGFNTVYTSNGYSQYTFTVTEKDGRWQRFQRPKGIHASAVSCVSAGNCVAAGDGSVTTQRNGRWGKAVRAADISAVSCSAVGACATGGSLGTDDQGEAMGAFTMSERYGRWRKPLHLYGVATIDAQIGSLSCGSVGNCAAGGSYFSGSFDDNGNPLLAGFVVGERGGKWGNPEVPPGLAALNPDNISSVNSVSCPADWTCAAVGSYTDAAGNGQAFVLGSV